ncbi:UDP-forming cellulose synthase catalytic subunit [Leptolyngbya sp. NIES-2104]|uniref:UDP-forming cellulose synthase catalytic subunit n=1 Tax=Leptolyngbya sp. NIES-2104 TaxID=1552121 RepID=UPI0006EC7DB5|nr:UDP-forming cellulose synthase catalytic subunit [Leptolyngbya sp. NIES-2104]GAP98835.1 cellulose synthase catalytic subunit [Leptolyngbya sp. NIES-2104]
MTNSTPSKRYRSKGQRVLAWFVDLIPNFFDRLFQKNSPSQLVVLMGLLLVLSVPLIVTPLEIWQQGIVAVILVGLGWAVTDIEHKHAKGQTSEYLHLFMVWLSLITTFRYLYYRTNYTLNLTSGWLDATCSVLLFLAELYAILTLALAFFQTLKLKERKAVDLSTVPEHQWFKVDIYIPTYSEDVEIVRKTALGALAIDYPADKKKVHILDDGRAEKFRERREQLRQMCKELGCTLLTRDNNDHAKAGNINTALRRTGGDLVLILDCDHIPVRHFLKDTVGFFYSPKVSLVQTPHWFYNPDPFERNLQTGGKIPVGNELFYKVLQKGNDFWNAAFFCGSAAVVRKSHLLEVGGIAVETVTEDCHTSLRLHSLGYESVYYDKIMVAGLAPEKFSAYVGQQIRWARGMAQILRLENPLLNPKLKLSIGQRICYFSATSHFFYGFPRLMYALAPAMFLVFGINPIRGLGLETLAYALPHFFVSTYANYITYKNVRFSFWNEIYEFAMSFHAGIVTMLAVFNPKLGSFNVTDKGLSVTKRSFDWGSAKALMIVALLVTAGVAAVPFWLILRPQDSEAVLVNMVWSFFNLILIVSALLVALEQPQLRRSHRLDRKLSATLYTNGAVVQGRTQNVSETGCQLIVDHWADFLEDAEIELIGDYGARAFVKGQIIRVVPVHETQSLLSIEFVDLTRAQLDALSVVIYSDVREWYSQQRENVDDPLQSFRFIVGSLTRSFKQRKPEATNIARVRKEIRAHAQLYWRGQFYSGVATRISNRSLQLEIQSDAIEDVRLLSYYQPLVGVLLSQTADESLPNRLLAKVEQIDFMDDRTVIELRFPDQIMQRQEDKIKQLVDTLN